jgi:prepilin-type processing-associated H-X9-DG protein
LATASLSLGLASLFCNLFTGIPAVILGILALRGINLSRPRLKGEGMATWGIITGVLGILVMTPITLAVVAMSSHPIDEWDYVHAPFGMKGDQEAMDRDDSLANLEDLASAMHDYEGVHKHLPPAAFSEPEGKRLLSWRVAILPYLNDPEASDLYREFKLDEPWDSDHNKQLLTRMPDIFVVPGKATQPGYTYYQVLTGPRTAFENPKGQTLDEFPDGLENTFLIVEAQNAVPWTKPDDLAYDPDKPLPRFGTHFGGFNAAFADGSAQHIPANTDTTTLRGLITRNGRERVMRPIEK